MKTNQSSNKEITVVSKKTGKVSKAKSMMANKPQQNKNYHPSEDENIDQNNKNDGISKSINEKPVDNTLKTDQVEKKVTEKKDPESVSEFVVSFFAPKSKVKTLSEKVAKKLNSEISGLTFDDDNVIKECVTNDSSLEKTKQLLILAFKYRSLPKVDKQLKDVVKKIVLTSEISEPKLEQWFSFTDDTADQSITELWQNFVVSKNNTTGKAKLNLELSKARRNVFFCIVLWDLSRRKIDFKKFIKTLSNTLFSFTDKKSKDEHIVIEYFSVNLEGKSCKNISALSDWFYGQLDTLSQSANNNLREKQSIEGLLIDEKKLTQAKDDEIRELKEELASYQAKISEVHENSRVLKIHLKDDLRKQKGRTLRALENELPMLQDALKALEREPAKITVAKDYIGRALDNLNNELEQLRSK